MMFWAEQPAMTIYVEHIWAAKTEWNDIHRNSRKNETVITQQINQKD